MLLGDGVAAPCWQSCANPHLCASSDPTPLSPSLRSQGCAAVLLCVDTGSGSQGRSVHFAGGGDLWLL